MILEFNGKMPQIGADVFIAPNACVIGDVVLHEGASVWYGAVIRGDRSPIVIGANTNIQDNCTLHTDPAYPMVIGAGVTIGHNAVLHGCSIEDKALIGMGAVVLNGAVVGSGAVVASGSVVREAQVVGPCHLVAGVPAVLKKELPPTRPKDPAEVYRGLAAEHQALLSRE